MSKITAFNPQLCNSFRKQVLAQLQSLADQSGVVIKDGRGSYSPTEYTFKLSFFVPESDGNVLTPEAQDLKDYANTFGLKPSDLFREFEYGGETCKVMGLKPNRPKFPILIKKIQSGKMFKFNEELVQRCLK